MNEPLYEEQREAAETDAEQLDPVLQEHQTGEMQAHWVAELEAGRKERKRFNQQGDKIIKRYADEQADETAESGASKYNIFYQVTDLKMSAIYARSPQPDVKRRFDDASDDVSRVASILTERSVSYELEAEGFDTKFRQTLFDRLVPGLGVMWARLDETIGEPELRPVVDPLTGLPAVDELGQPVTEPIPGSEIKNQLAETDYVAWNDFLWSPCRVWSDCRWEARRIPMSKDAVKARFGRTAPGYIKDLCFTLPTSTEQNPSYQPKNATVPTVDVWEIWDKERRLIWWVVEDAPVALDVQEDRTEFPDFFPSPLPPLCRTTTSSTIPVSDFHLVRYQYNELDDLNDRCAKLTKAMRLQWVYDGSNPTLKDLFGNGAEFVGIPVNNWAAMQSEKGGIKGSIEFIPLSDIAATHATLLGSREQVKAQIYTIEGVSDGMLGMATKYASAEASSQATSLGAARLDQQRQDAADYISRVLRLKAHLIAKFYKPEFIVKRAGQLNQADLQYVPDAIKLLRDEQLRRFRLEVSTESIQRPNQDRLQRERTALVTAVTGFMSQTIPAVKQQPELGPLALNLIKFAVASFPGSDDIEGAIDEGLDQLQRAAQQPQPPKPSDAEIKAQAQEKKTQADLAMTQIDAQKDVQVAQIHAGAKRDVGAMQAQMDAQETRIKELELALKARKQTSDTAIDAARVQIDATRAAHDNAATIATLGR